MLTWFKTIFNVICLGCLTMAPVPTPASAVTPATLGGYIVLQVEENGEAWYVHPTTFRRHYLGRPADAFAVMRATGLGISNADFLNIQTNPPKRLYGRILLKVEDLGRAYYLDPRNGNFHYLGRPADAFEVMRQRGLGITNADLATIPTNTAPTADSALPERVTHAVPFTAQAPFGDWSDPRQQDGCEEASALMAIRWARSQSLTKDEALSEIIAAAEYQEERWGNFLDTSAQHTVERIMNDYFDFTNARVVNDVTIADIKQALADGNIVIAPFNGQLLHNPNFTPPGPLRHMAVITGYDAANNTFITNDPGTRNGEGFRYDMDMLHEALRDYPSGHHEPIESIDKTIIIVSPEPAQ